MKCRDARQMADSVLAGAQPSEKTREALQHLESCPSCRAEIDEARRLRGALHGAFGRAPELQASAAFQDRLRDQLRDAAVPRRRSRVLSWRWFALAASVVLAAGVVLFNTRSATPSEALARDAAGDHWDCALKHRAVRTPVSLDEAAQRFDRAYRVLLAAPPDDVATTAGTARVTDRHSCAFGERRFGHVVMEYRGHVVSVLVTANRRTGHSGQDAKPTLIGRPMNGVSVVSVNATNHAVLVVSDLETAELTRLSETVAVPLAGRLGADTVARAGASRIAAGGVDLP